MSDLNTPQKDTLKNAIKTSSTRSQVAEEQTKANAINDAMHVLRQNIANNENVKNQSSYINAEPEKQNAYTDAVNAANAIINEQTPTLNANTINQKAQEVLTTKNALDGEAQLRKAKENATREIDGLNQLTQAQKIKKNH